MIVILFDYLGMCGGSYLMDDDLSQFFFLPLEGFGGKVLL